jgi:very-short-patch-repair endonuclease
LWRKLRKNALEGLHFRRQHRIGPYVVDFCCVPQRLIIELDGYFHSDTLRVRRDDARTEWLNGQGYCVLRFQNALVLNGQEDVLAAILKAVRLEPPSLTLPPSGGGK